MIFCVFVVVFEAKLGREQNTRRLQLRNARTRCKRALDPKLHRL